MNFFCRLNKMTTVFDSWHLHFRVSHLKELLGGHVCLCMISINSVLPEKNRRGELPRNLPPFWCCPPPLPCRLTPEFCQSEWWSCGHTGQSWKQYEFSYSITNLSPCLNTPNYKWLQQWKSGVNLLNFSSRVVECRHPGRYMCVHRVVQPSPRTRVVL